MVESTFSASCFESDQVFGEPVLGIDPHISYPTDSKGGGTIFDEYGRQKIADTRSFPHSVHGIVCIDTGRGTYTWGTGIMIGKDVVLTAAHNIYDQQRPRREKYRNIQFIPVRNGTVTRSEIIDVDSDEIFVLESFISYTSTPIDGAYPDDFAIMILKQPIGEMLGYFGLKVIEKSLWKNRIVNVVGYPYDKVSDKPGIYELWKASGEIEGIDKQGMIIHRISTSGGSSGSGLYIEEGKNKFSVIGIHVSGNKEFNNAIGITEERYSQIQTWIREKRANLQSVPHSLKKTSLLTQNVTQKNITIDIFRTAHFMGHSQVEVAKGYSPIAIAVVAGMNLNLSSFSLDIGPEMSQKDLYNLVQEKIQLKKNSFYLTLLNEDKKLIRVSRNSSYILGSQLLTRSILEIQQFPATLHNVTFQVKFENKEHVFEFKASLENTVRELAEIIDIETKIPCSAQKLLYNSEIFDNDNQKIKELGLTGGEMIKVLRGSEIGGELQSLFFANIHNPAGPESFEWSSSAPKWRIAEPGLSLEGKCKNEKCDANEKWVIINKGSNISYDLRSGIDANFCPICKEFTEVEFCAFNNCLYTYTGKHYQGKGKPSVFVKSQERKEVGDEYNRFSPHKVGTKEWETLVIATFQLPKKDREEKFCPLCSTQILEEGHRLSCNHEYHSQCLKALGTSDCVLCTERSTIKTFL